MRFALARKHKASLRYSSVEARRAAYDFGDLQSFLDLYYEGASVLRDAGDFHALTAAYLEKAHADGVVHAEIFCDPQTHLNNGVPLEVVFGGLAAAIAESAISAELIVCFLRSLTKISMLFVSERSLRFMTRLE